jgi:hypothetical protein
MSDSHFARRCRERGIASVPGNILAAWLMQGIRDRDENIARFVRRMDDECDLYRFIVPEGVFYCVAGADHWPRTLYTQEMKRKFDKARKSERYRRSRAGQKTFIRFRDDRKVLA